MKAGGRKKRGGEKKITLLFPGGWVRVREREGDSGGSVGDISSKH